MHNLKQTTLKTQVKINQYLYKYKNQLKLPEYNFLSDITYGILKSKHIHLAKISRTLLESITPKKTEERLSYHLGKKSISKRIQDIYHQVNSHRIKNCKYLIYDGSDIIKKEAEKMEGLSLVRDGSKSVKNQKPVLSNGYHWDNIIGVDSDGKDMIPLYSEIYSSRLDPDYAVSENRKIIKK